MKTTKNTQPQKTEIERLIDSMRTDAVVRTSVTTKNFGLFVRMYFPHYFTFGFAPFHERFFEIAEKKVRHAAVLAFRSSGKTTVLTQFYPIWAMVGEQQKKSIIIISQTQHQARSHLSNIKAELERNGILKNDLGPFEEQDEAWNSGAIFVSKYNAKITALSREQSLRGLRSKQYRPDLIICDDVEDIASTRTLESRNATFTWYTSEVMPMGDENTKVLYIGNLVHEDCTIERLRNAIEKNGFKSEYLRVGIIDETTGESSWPARYPDRDAIDALRHSIPDEDAWYREFELRIPEGMARLVSRSDIQYYDQLPGETPHLLLIGVDLAISETQSADYTAIVPMALYGRGKDRKIYVLNPIIKKRLDYTSTKSAIAEVIDSIGSPSTVHVLIEDVGYQRVIAQDMTIDGYHMESCPVRGDKRSRLSVPSSWVKMGKVLFPRSGAEDLVTQLVYFGSERFDDLCDAFSIGFNYAMDTKNSSRLNFATTDKHGNILIFDPNSPMAKLELIQRRIDKQYDEDLAVKLKAYEKSLEQIAKDRMNKEAMRAIANYEALQCKKQTIEQRNSVRREAKNIEAKLTILKEKETPDKSQP